LYVINNTLEATIWRLPSLIQLLISTKAGGIPRLIGGVGMCIKLA